MAELQNYLHDVDQIFLNQNFKELENWPAFQAERDTVRQSRYM
jgi:hypothetical protein